MKRGFAAQFGERFTRRLFGWLKFLSPQHATGYFGIFTTVHRAVVSHFRFKKDLILYLNSSRAASSGELKFQLYMKSGGFICLSNRSMDNDFFKPCKLVAKGS